MPLPSNRWLWFGGSGTVVTGLCCVTPAAVITLAAVGAGGMASYLDTVLLPLLAFFAILFAIGLWRWWRTNGVRDRS